MADFSSKLRDIVDSKGVSQAWLADKAGTTEATISRYMSGIHKPNLDIVANIAKALGVSIDYIMDLSLNPAPYQEPEKDIVVLCSAYRRTDDARKNIIWATLEPYLTPEEKTYIWQTRQDESTAG